MKKAVIFVGRIDEANWPCTINFVEKYNLDVYVISYSSSLDETKSIINTIKNKFGYRLKSYYIDRNIVNDLQYNQWFIHPRSIQYWRLWDFYMKHPEIYENYDVLIKSRVDMCLPKEWEMPDEYPNNTLFTPKYHNHRFGVVWADHFAFGEKNVMKKYCKIWEQIPEENPCLNNPQLALQLFFHNFSPESMLQNIINQYNIEPKMCFDEWHLYREELNKNNNNK